MRHLLFASLILLTPAVPAFAAEAPVVPKCETNADCVPAQCCHPTSCVHKSQAPDCSKAICTMDCRPGTLDCQNGQCECQNGICNAHLKDK